MMIKKLLFMVAMVVTSMSYGQTTAYSISHSGSDNLVISSNGYFLNDDGNDGVAPFSETTVTVTSTITWDAGADPVEAEPTSFGTLWMPIKNAANDNIFAKSSGFKTNVDVVSDSGAGTSPRIITWEVTTLTVLDQEDADNKVAATLKFSGGDPDVGSKSLINNNQAITIVDAYYPAGYIDISNVQTTIPTVTRGESFTMSFDYVANTTISGLRYRILLVHPANGEEDPYANATIGDVTHADITTTEGTLISGSSTINFTFPLGATLNGLSVDATVDDGDGNQIVTGSSADRYDLQRRNDTDDGWINDFFGMTFPIVNEAPVASVDNDLIGELEIYPNPTNGIIHISDVSGLDTVQVLNVLGQVVKTFNAETIIDISELKSGVYFLQAANGLKRKIIKN